jgi:hypothetical protein
MNLISLASVAITGALLTTLQISSIPYTVALSPATVAYQQAGIDGASGVTQSPFNPVVSPYRTTGSPIILGGGGTQVYLKPNLPATVERVPAFAIVSAELRIPLAQQAASSTGGSVTFGSYQINSNWSQGSSNSFYAPATSSSPFATSRLYYDAQSGRSSGSTQTLSFDVTWIVREWVSGRPNYGIMIQELNTNQTTGLWWQAPLGTQPELIVTVQRDYLPNTSPSGGISSPPPQEHSSGGVVVRTQSIDAGMSWGIGVYVKTVDIQTGNKPVESFESRGVQGEFELRLGRLEMRMAASVGGVTDLAYPTITLPPKDGLVGEFSLLGSAAIPMGKKMTMLPGLGLYVDTHVLTFGGSFDRLDHSRSLGGLLLTNEWRFEPVQNTTFSAHVALSPVGATSESFKRSQGANWVQQEAEDIFTTWIEGGVSAKLQMLPHAQLTAGYAASATFVPAQTVDVIYTDSTGNYVLGTVTIDRAVTNTSRAYIGFSYFF